LKRRTFPRAVWLAAAGLLLAGWVHGGQITDRIWLKGRKEPHLGQISGESIDGVKVGLATFSITGIVRIQYGDAPFAFREAEQHREQGRYEEATRLYETALRDKLMQRRWWLDPNCKYKIALCHLGQDEYDDAVKAFQKVLGEHKDSRWTPDAILGLGEVYFEQKKYNNAIQQFDALAKLAAAKNFEEWQLRATLWKAKALRANKNPDDALRLIQQIVDTGQGGKYGDIVIAARTEQAVILMAKGQNNKAVDLLQKLIQEIAPSVAQEIGDGSETRNQRIEATCFNTLGRCYLQMASKAGDAKKKESLHYEALLSFLWNVVLYQRLPAVHAEALFYAAQCFEKLNQRTRATELRNELVQRYPDSTFARQVRPEGRGAGN